MGMAFLHARSRVGLLLLAVALVVVAFASGGDGRFLPSLDITVATVHAPTTGARSLAVRALDMDEDAPEDEAWDEVAETPLPVSATGESQAAHVAPAPSSVVGRASHDRLFRPPRG